MLLIWIFAVILATLVFEYMGKVLNRCEIAQELLLQGFSCDSLSNWVCLVESESAGNTSSLGILNGRDKFYHGLFQISEEYWCRKGYPGGGCNVTCESLTNDDISIAAACAMKIYNRRGFQQWAGWKVRCEGRNIDISKCVDKYKCN